jgi:uncharacterized protein YuzB (UPF0349 family)
MTEVRLCENNFSHGTEMLIDRIKEELEDVSVDVEPCLGYCGDCATGPFALVNDELVKAESAEELFHMIEDIVNE